jgi:hypothetical protein
MYKKQKEGKNINEKNSNSNVRNIKLHPEIEKALEEKKIE